LLREWPRASSTFSRVSKKQSKRSRNSRQYLKYFFNQRFGQDTSLIRTETPVCRFQSKSKSFGLRQKPQLLRQSLMTQWFHGVFMEKTLKASTKSSALKKKLYNNMFKRSKCRELTSSSYTPLSSSFPPKLYKRIFVLGLRRGDSIQNKRYRQFWRK